MKYEKDIEEVKLEKIVYSDLLTFVPNYYNHNQMLNQSLSMPLNNHCYFQLKGLLMSILHTYLFDIHLYSKFLLMHYSPDI